MATNDILARMTLLLLQRELRAVADHVLTARVLDEDDLVDRMTAAVLSSGAQVLRLVEPATLTRALTALSAAAPATPDPLADDIATLLQNSRADRQLALLHPFHLRLALKQMLALRPDLAVAALAYQREHPDLARGTAATELCQAIEEWLIEYDAKIRLQE